MEDIEGLLSITKENSGDFGIGGQYPIAFP